MQRVLRIPNSFDATDAYVATHPSLLKLLHAERAAALTYELAMQGCSGPWVAEAFAELCGSHASCARALEEHCQLASSPRHDEACSETAELAAESSSPSAHLIAMLQNTEVELAVAYHRALQDASLSADAHEIILRTLLPTVREHIVVLAELLMQE